MTTSIKLKKSNKEGPNNTTKKRRRDFKQNVYHLESLRNTCLHQRRDLDNM